MNIFARRGMVQKICILSLVCLTIPSLFFSIYLYQRQSKGLQEQLLRDQSIAIEQTTNSIDTTLHAVSELSMDLTYSDLLTSFLDRQRRWEGDLTRFPIWTQKQFQELLSAIKYSLKYRNLGIYAANIFVSYTLPQEGDYFWSADRLSSFDFFQQFQNTDLPSALYYLDAKETEKLHASCGYTSGSAEKTTILLIQKIELLQPAMCIGYTVFECSPQKIFPMLFSSSGQNKGYFAWFHDSGKGHGAEPSSDVLSALKRGDDTSAFLIESDNQQYLCCTMEHFGITVLDTQPLMLDAYKLPALSLSLVLAAFALLQFIVLTVFLHKSFQHLHSDLNLMDYIIAHGFQERIPEIRKDEIGMIAHRYNILLDKINSLIQETVRKETAQTQAQLKALQYQINPHFIYNTLSIFSGYAAQNGQDILAESIDSFGQLLRYNIKNEGLYATIESELRTAASLINVYNIRYFNQLTLTVDVPASLRQFPIIKFLLQPLLENAILHGFVPPNTSLDICISIRQTDDLVEIKVSDNGNGMSRERLLEVQTHMVHSSEDLPASENSTFIGLRNIYQRLILFYGQKAQLTIDSEEACGTLITIQLPADSLKE